jgi:D-amino-acid dehydrogenase
VVVLERNEVGQGASLGNTGWVCPSFSYPLPAPGIIREGLRGMLHGGGPLAIRPTLDPTFLRWLLGFRRSATRERWERGARALIALNRHTLELFDSYAEAGVEFEMHRSGLLVVATTPAGLESYASIFRDLRVLGFERATRRSSTPARPRGSSRHSPPRESQAESTRSSTAMSARRA